MSTDRGEPDPQEWPTYPGIPNDPSQPPAQPRRPSPRPDDPGPRPYAEPDPTADSAYQAYRDYARPDMRQHHLQPYQQAPYQRAPDQQCQHKSAAWLQDKWLWIIGGIVAVFVITGLAQGNFPWLAIIFGFIVWNILRHKRRHG